MAEATLEELSMSFDGPAGSRVELTNHAGAHRQPLGTASRRSGAAGWQRAVTRERRFTAETAGRLAYL